MAEDLKKGLSVKAELGRTDPRDRKEPVVIPGAMTDHIHQDLIAEHHVRGHTARGRERQPNGLQFEEEFGIHTR